MSTSTPGPDERKGNGETTPPATPEGASQSKEKDGVSGLHDIRALAKTAIERHSGKHAAVSEEQAEAMLASSSMTNLERVVLPEPGREVTPVVGDEAPRRSSAPLVAGVLAAAVAAAVVVYLVALRGRGAAESDTVAQAGTAPAAAQAADPQPNLEPGAPVEPVETADPAGEPEEPGADTAAGADTDPAAAEARDDAQDEGKEDGRKGDERKGDRAGRGDRGDRSDKGAKDKGDRSDPVDKGDKGAGKPGDKGASADKADDAKAPARNENSLDSLLDQAVGAPADPGPAATPDKPAAPPPSSLLPVALSRSDVRKGMSTIRARVQACYDKFKVPGTVSIRLRIEPDGTVSSAEAVDGKFRATETGFCVAEAVKAARFAQFSGAAMTISNYPFKLE